MTLTDARESYYSNSGRASDAARQLAFAGIALVWLFKKDIDGVPTIDGSISPAVKWFIIALGTDLLQYVGATLAWGLFARQKEQQPDIDIRTEFSAPRQLNWPGLLFFGLKILCVAAGYIVLSYHLWPVLDGHVAAPPNAPRTVNQRGP